MIEPSFTVAAPASSANMGSGYDCVAAALDLWNTLDVVPGSGHLSVIGEGADNDALLTNNLIAHTFEQFAGARASECDLACTNRIPLARGLGSSTAAAALGIVAAWTVCERSWSSDDLFRELTAIDGHPDNAAAVAYGGIQWCNTDAGASTLTLNSTLVAICITPPSMLPTARARAVVPRTVSVEDACAQASAAGLLAVGIALDRDDLLRTGLTGDVLHEQARAGLVPALARTREAFDGDERALGVTLSGAGSTVAVWTRPRFASSLHTMCATLFSDDHAVRTLTVTPHGAGIRSNS